MHRSFLKAKLHRATITAADLEYEGSITIDRDLCSAANLQEFEQVDVLDINNGARFTTYVIYGSHGEIQVNGAAARLVSPGDLAIIIAYCSLPAEKVANHKPRVVLLGPDNKITGAHDHTMREPSADRGVETETVSLGTSNHGVVARVSLAVGVSVASCAEWLTPVVA